VLLLDVARFKYPPHWVPLPLLYQSMQATDSATGRCRGYVVMSRSEVATSLLLTVSRSQLDKVSSLRPPPPLRMPRPSVAQVSWHQLAHCLAASAKESAASALGAESSAAEDALQSTMEMLLTELGAALVPITESAPPDVSAAAAQCCSPSATRSAAPAGDPSCCQEMAAPSLFGDDHVAAIHSLRYAVEGLPLFAIGQRAWARVRVAHASPFNPPMCGLAHASVMCYSDAASCSFGFGPAHVASVLLLALSPQVCLPSIRPLASEAHASAENRAVAAVGQPPPSRRASQ
jgi:hypothetical protein